MPTHPASLVLQLLFAAVLLHACFSTLWAAKGASGWFSPHCDGASFYLSKVEGLPSKQKINLNLRQHFPWWNYRPQEVWEDVYAERCTSIGKCEAATHARIWLDKAGPKDKHVSGKYEMDFGGEHLAANFLVKYRNDKTWLCE
jgi:hypothetical protein